MTYDSDDIKTSVWIGLVIGFILNFTILGLVWRIYDSEFKREAVAKNCAEYAVDEYGRTTFKFKDYTDKKNLTEKD